MRATFKAILRNSGITPRLLPSVLRGWLRFRCDRKRFLEMSATSSSRLPMGRDFPMLREWDEAAGNLGSYFFQDRLVASWIFERNPSIHYDVASRFDGFIGSLSVFRIVHVLDIRPSPPPVPNVIFHRADLTKPLAGEWQHCTESLSCLHSLEHFGLGRYGDEVDPDGHLKGLTNLMGMVKSGGRFYLSVPVGRERVEFNAHRVFAIAEVLKWFESAWTIERFALVSDAGITGEGEGFPPPEWGRDFEGVFIIEAKKGPGGGGGSKAEDGVFQ